MKTTKLENVDAFVGMFMDRLRENWSGYHLTFMFKHIGGSPNHVAEQMEDEVTRVYAKVLTRVIRKKQLYKMAMLLPFWIICPDYPVPKGRDKKQPLNDVAVNDGRHMHALAAIPPWSELREDLVSHFNEKQAHYVPPRNALLRLHCERVTHDPDYLGRYALKAILRGVVAETEILLLPRVWSEMPTKDD